MMRSMTIGKLTQVAGQRANQTVSATATHASGGRNQRLVIDRKRLTRVCVSSERMSDKLLMMPISEISGNNRIEGDFVSSARPPAIAEAHRRHQLSLCAI